MLNLDLKEELDLESSLFLGVDVPIPNKNIPCMDYDAISTFLLETCDSSSILDANLAIFDTIKHIPHFEFFSELEKCINIFNENCSGNPYAVVWDTKFNGSKRWVFELAKPLLRQKPEIGIYGYPGADVVVPWLIKNGIFDLTFFDDGGFGGSQVSCSMDFLGKEYLKRGFTPNFTVVIPYLTDEAKSGWGSYECFDLNIINTQKLFSVQELIGESYMSVIYELRGRERYASSYYDLNLPSVFFDHNKPDELSMNPLLRDFLVFDDSLKPYRSGSYAIREKEIFDEFTRFRTMLYSQK